ncbi:MAG: hypothetical protein JNM76_12085 [Betaproteobacteria bacterium]|nr:hypothetical protein [Betaproteobacteria bacterium]
MQDKFEWKQVAAAAVTADVMQGLEGMGWVAPAGSSPPIHQQMIRGAIQSTVHQGVSVAIGAQDKFSWKAVAVSAVSAPIANKVGDLVRGGIEGLMPTASGADTKGLWNGAAAILGNTASGFTKQVAVRAASGGQVKWQNILADSFGNALGDALSPSNVKTGDQEEKLSVTHSLLTALGVPEGPWARTAGSARMAISGGPAHANSGGHAHMSGNWSFEDSYGSARFAAVRTDSVDYNPLLAGTTARLRQTTEYDSLILPDGRRPAYIDPDTGAATYTLPPQAVIEGRPLDYTTPTFSARESSFTEDYLGRLNSLKQGLLGNLDRVGGDVSTPDWMRFGAAMARGPATWIPSAAEGIAALGGYGLDSRFRGAVNDKIGTFLSSNPVDTVVFAANDYLRDKSSLEIAGGLVNFAGSGAIGVPFGKLAGMALTESASLAGRGGQAALGFARRLDEIHLEWGAVNNAGSRYQAGAVASATFRDLRSEVIAVLPENAELLRLGRQGAAIVRLGDDILYSVPKNQYSLIPELKAMDSMGDLFTKRVQMIADGFDPARNLTFAQQARLDMTPDGWLKDKFMSAYKGSYIHDQFDDALTKGMIPGGLGFKYNAVGPDVVSRTGLGLKYEITQLTPSLNAIFSHTKKYPNDLLRYVTYR